MFTNDIKKGMLVKLTNGWYGTMMDNMHGNTRMVEVEGYFTEIGSVYAWDIELGRIPDDGLGEGEWLKVELTEKQIATMDKMVNYFGRA